MSTVTPEEIIISAVNDYGRKSFYGLMSGGKDSMSVTHFVADNFPDLFKGVLYCDTGIGLEETKNFVIDECQRLGWKLYIREPQMKSYRQWVLDGGFPQVGSHGMIMRYIKFDSMRRFAYERKDEDPCMISGVRKNESKKRMRYDIPINHESHLWFVCPFLYKSTTEVYEYLAEHHLKKSPCYTNLHISGDCLCGSFSTDPSEILMIRATYPEMYKKIKMLEAEVKLEIESLEIEVRMIARKNNTLFERMKEFDIRKSTRWKRDRNLSDYEEKIAKLNRLKSFCKWGNNTGATQVENQTTLDSLICEECSETLEVSV